MSAYQWSDPTKNPQNKSHPKRAIFNRPFLVVLIIMVTPFVYMKLRYKPQPPSVNLETRILLSSVSTSPDGRYVLFGGKHPTAWLMDLPFFHVIKNLPLNSDAALAVDLSYDATKAAIYETDRSISVWDLNTGRISSSFSTRPFEKTGETPPIKKERRQLALSPDASKLLLLTPDKSLLLLDARKGKTIRFLEKTKTNPVQWFDFLPVGKTLVWLDGVGFHFQNVNEEEIIPIPFDSAELQSFLLAPDGNALYAGSKSGFVYRFDIPSKTHEPLFHHPDPVSALNFTDDGSLLVGGEFGYVAIWRLDSHCRVHSFFRKSKALGGMHWGGENQLVSVFEKGGRAWNWRVGRGFLSVYDGFKRAANGDIVQSPAEPMKEYRRPKSADLYALLHTPLQQSFNWNEEGIDRIVSTLSETIGIPIQFTDGVKYVHQYREPVASSLILDNALKHFSLEYRILTDGSIHIGRPETLKALDASDSHKKLMDVPELQDARFSAMECMYVSDLIEKIDPDRALQFVVENDGNPRITLKLNRPTPIQILEAVLHPNGLDYGFQNRQIYVGKKDGGLEFNHTLVRNTIGESDYRIRSKLSKFKTYDWDGVKLRDALEDFRADFTFDFAMDEGVQDLVVHSTLQPMHGRRVLDSLLHPHGLDWVLQREGSYRIGRLEDLEKDVDLVFSPQKLSSFLIAYHSRFKTSQLKYAGTERIRSGRLAEEIKRINVALFKTIERAREYVNAETSVFPDSTIPEFEENVLNDWTRISEANVQKIFDVRKRLESDFTRDATKVYTTDSAYRCAEFFSPNEIYDYYYDVLNGRGETIKFFYPLEMSEPIDAKGRIWMPPTMKQIDRPCRFGADLDWFLQCGFQIDSVDWMQRTIDVSDAADEQKYHLYRFTLLDGRNAYWKQLDVFGNGRLVRRVLCSNFIDVSGMLVPQSVRIVDCNGNDFWYLDLGVSGGGGSDSLLMPWFSIGWGGFRYECNMKLLEARVNQTVLDRIVVGAERK